MVKRILLGGVLGGIILFVWGALSHTTLGLGSVGFQVLPNEGAVLAMMQENIPQSGLYFFPWVDESNPAATEEWEKKYQTGPHGLLIYHPPGGQALTPGQLVTELATNIAAALLVACLLALALAGLSTFGLKVLFVALIGLLPGLDVDVSYWNWYGFPGDYTVAVMADHLIGWVLAGLVLGAIVKRTSA